MSLLKEFEHATHINTSVFKLVMMMCQVVFMCHLLGCLWHLIGCDPDENVQCSIFFEKEKGIFSDDYCCARENVCAAQPSSRRFFRRRRKLNLAC